MTSSSYFFSKKRKNFTKFQIYVANSYYGYKEVLLLDKKEWDEVEENLYIYIFIYNMIDRETYYRDVNLFKKLVAIDKVKKIYRFIIFWRKKN